MPRIEELSPAPDVLQTLSAFSAWPGVILFDSALRREDFGRYSFLAADPWARVDCSDAAYGSDPFGVLRDRLLPQEPMAGLPPFQGGAAGLLGFGLGRAFERLPGPRIDEFALPALAVGLYDWVIAWDHQQSRAWLISQGFPESDPAARQRRATERAGQVRAALSTRDRAQPWKDVRAELELAPQFALPGHPGVTSNFSRPAYLEAVARAIEYIRAGDIFQVNLSQRLLTPQREGALDLYARLRQKNAATFAGYFAWDDWVIASASPERFVRVQGREVETRPIKGTRRRSAAPEADAFTRDELRESEKDQAENVMIVDLLRNDLSRVCRPGSIRVPQLCRVETYAMVQHLVSVVQGTLRDDQTAWDLLRASFPGGSVTGAPKVRSMEIIAELEPTERGAYCGSLFYLGHDGAMDSNILIRTFTLRHGWIQFPVGGGIVAQSAPVAEYEETLHKAAGMLAALGD